ncbi:hypothetical protein A2U01_0108952, partial [Trifolium medium]|nr:hypothetical protein [Trifolium medium]
MMQIRLGGSVVDAARGGLGAMRRHVL